MQQQGNFGGALKLSSLSRGTRMTARDVVATRSAHHTSTGKSLRNVVRTGDAAVLEHRLGRMDRMELVAQLRAYDDATLASVFASGTAVIPSQESPYNATGTPTYDFCVGRTFFSAFTPNSSVARSVWPTGVDSPINNLAERVWWGKVFYNDGSNSP